MKKTLLLTLVAVFYFLAGAKAQTEKGAKLLGGSGNFHLNKNYSMSLAPQFGYFVAKNFAIGSSVNFTYSKYSLELSGFNYRSRSISTGVSPFVRYYFAKALPFQFFTQGEVNFLRSWSKRITDTETDYQTSNSSTLGIGAGVVYFITEQVGLEGLLMYTNNKTTSLERTNNLDFRIGLQIYLPSSRR